MDSKFRTNVKQSVDLALPPFYILQLEYIFKPDVRTHFGDFKEDYLFGSLTDVASSYEMLSRLQQKLSLLVLWRNSWR